MKQQVARPVRELRLEREKSLGDISACSGISRGILSMIERGIMVATRDQADAIAQALDLDPGTLVTRSMLVLEEQR